MGQLSAKLRGGGETLTYWCQGCEITHSVRVRPDGKNEGAAWGFDWNLDHPTFSPSVLTTSGHYMSSHKLGKPCWCTFKEQHPGRRSPSCFRCHTFIRGGMVEFLGDCSHALAGQTLPLPPLPAHLRDDWKPE